VSQQQQLNQSVGPEPRVHNIPFSQIAYFSLNVLNFRVDCQTSCHELSVLSSIVQSLFQMTNSAYSLTIGLLLGVTS
jgi:hypothetical protein